MEVVYATLEDAHNTSLVKSAKIPKHSAIFVRIGGRLFNLSEQDGALAIRVEKQLVIEPKVTNTILLREQPHK